MLVSVPVSVSVPHPSKVVDDPKCESTTCEREQGTDQRSDGMKHHSMREEIVTVAHPRSSPIQ